MCCAGCSLSYMWLHLCLCVIHAADPWYTLLRCLGSLCTCRCTVFCPLCMHYFSSRPRCIRISRLVSVVFVWLPSCVRRISSSVVFVSRPVQVVLFTCTSLTPLFPHFFPTFSPLFPHFFPTFSPLFPTFSSFSLSHFSSCLRCICLVAVLCPSYFLVGRLCLPSRSGCTIHMHLLSPHFFPTFSPLFPHFFPTFSPLFPHFFPTFSPLFPTFSPLFPLFFPTFSPLFPSFSPLFPHFFPTFSPLFPRPPNIILVLLFCSVLQSPREVKSEKTLSLSICCY